VSVRGYRSIFFHLLLGRKMVRWGLYCNIWDSIVGGKDIFLTLYGLFEGSGGGRRRD